MKAITSFMIGYSGVSRTDQNVTAVYHIRMRNDANVHRVIHTSISIFRD